MKSTPTTQARLDAEWKGRPVSSPWCMDRSPRFTIATITDDASCSIDFECDRPKGHSGQHAHGDMNGLVVVWGRP